MMIRIWRFAVLFYLINVVGSIAQKFSNFTCDDTTEINLVDVCDGVVNCEDRSDETGCDNNPILFYYVYNRMIPALSSVCQSYDTADNYYERYFISENCAANYYEFINLNITGVYLNDQKEFSITLLMNERGAQGGYRRPPEESISITNIRVRSNGPQLDTWYTSSKKDSGSVDLFKRVTRAGDVQNVESIGKDVRTLAVDSTTTHIYYISDTTIKVCDKNFVICVPLSSKFINNPTLLTISSKQRLLFWVEKISTQQFYLYKYALDLSKKMMVIYRNLKNPAWLTTDVIQERVYWMDAPDANNIVSSIHSISFGGTDHELILGSSAPVSSFAVFDNTLYWSDTTKPQIWMCSVLNCAKPTLFQQIDSTHATFDVYEYYSLQVGSLTLDHHSSPTKAIENACTNSSCSHFCLLDQDTSFNCYCAGLEQPLPANKNNGYCEDATLIVADHNHLYVLGFVSDSQFAPITTGFRINMNSISTVTYNSLKGTVILTEVEQQKIYSWVPRTGDLSLFSDDGVGSITSIEFDNCANNLYWIDPVNRLIRVMNLDTRLKLTILEGNSTYVPIELTLAPTKGYMYVQFLKRNSIVIIERIPMDGGRVRLLIHVDKEIDDVASLHLHYMRETETLYLLDRQTNKIRYQLNEESGFQDVKYSQTVGQLQSITSLKNSIFWLEDDVICQGEIEATQMSLKRKIPLGFKQSGKGTLKMTPVTKFAVHSRNTKCLRNNGGCQELCLVSDKIGKIACTCTGNKTVVNGSLCRDASVNVVNFTTTKENSTIGPSILSKSGFNTEKASTMWTKDFIHTTIPTTEHEQTESTHIKSCPPIRDCPPCVETTTAAAPSTRNVQIEIRKNETKSIESWPACQCSISPLMSSEQSSSYHIFYSTFNSVMAILLGFVLGYVFQRYRSRSKHSNSIFRGGNGPLELSRMQAGSTMTLCSKVTDESANKKNGNVEATQTDVKS